MRRALSVLLCIGLLIGVGACGSDSDRSSAEAPRTSQQAQSGTSYETEPVPAPDLTLETMGGRQINLADQDGKVILVNFWATWCGPCRREIPDLVKLYSDMKDEGLIIVGIAVDQEGAEVVEPYVQEQSINYPIVLDPDQSTEAHFDAMYGLPTTYVVNPEGQIVRRVLGVFPVDDMKPTLKDMLDSAPSV
jgi:thiol-disulfide isomerase/thioredoxin